MIHSIKTFFKVDKHPLRENSFVHIGKGHVIYYSGNLSFTSCEVTEASGCDLRSNLISTGKFPRKYTKI